MFLFKPSYNAFDSFPQFIYITVCCYLNSKYRIEGSNVALDLHYSMLLFKQMKKSAFLKDFEDLHYSMSLFKLNEISSGRIVFANLHYSMSLFKRQEIADMFILLMNL